MTNKCIGFGEFEGKCTNMVCSYSPHWCERCEKLRRDSISKQLKAIMDSFQVTAESHKE